MVGVAGTMAEAGRNPLCPSARRRGRCRNQIRRIRAMGRRPAIPQLPVGDPLHEFDEFDFGSVLAFAQTGTVDFVRLPPLFRPLPPWLPEFVPQRLEAGEARQQRSTLGAKLLEITPVRGRRIDREPL